MPCLWYGPLSVSLQILVCKIIFLAKKYVMSVIGMSNSVCEMSHLTVYYVLFSSPYLFF